ncbi:hypothetical protein [Thalassospira lucentensis]|uniref:hypothetical protein n=1 Tax=Thalassospira lucentensis TaxID=168935 RepID=UPI00142E5E01|nr:hypothetical protein [Thalassospira lucentensis]NIZ00778.1 hypothetical protein [Thalassospira lucentensis]
MKTMIPMIAIAAGLLVAAQSAQAASLKSYCNGNDFYGKVPERDGFGDKYPHLHCGSRFITYSPSKNKGNRINFLDKGGLSVSKAGNACLDANNKGADRLTAKIAEICTDYGAACGC